MKVLVLAKIARFKFFAIVNCRMPKLAFVAFVISGFVLIEKEVKGCQSRLFNK